MGSAGSDDGGARTPRVPRVLLAGLLGVVIAVAAALGGALTFSGARWSPGGLPSARLPVAKPPAATLTAPASQPPATGQGPDLTWLIVVLGALAAAVIVFFVVRYVVLRLRNRGRAEKGELQDVPIDVIGPGDPTVETAAPYLRRGLRRALDELDGDRTPTDAIIAAWLGLQEAAEDAGFERGTAETPTEFTARILRSVDVDEASLATLRRLYLAVRFGDATATVDDIESARAALRKLDEHWTVTR